MSCAARSCIIEHAFICAGQGNINKELKQSSYSIRRYRSFFGIGPDIASKIWGMVAIPAHSYPKHLLFSLLFLKNYNAEHLNASLCNVDERTFRKWSWYYIREMAGLSIVSSFQYFFIN